MIKLDDEIVDLFCDPEAVKLLGTVDEEGVPHVVSKDSLRVLGEGYIAYGERSDCSKAYKNMTRSIWFNKPVTVTLVKGEISYQIKGIPYKCVVNGPLLRDFVVSERERGGPDADVSSVWIIEPQDLRVETPAVRRKEDAAKRPYLNRHLELDAAM